MIQKMALRIIIDDFLREPLSDSSINEIMTTFKDKGILIDQAYLIFKAVFPNPTYEQLNSIVAATKRYLDKIQMVLRDLNKGTLTPDQKDKKNRVQELYNFTTTTVLPKLEEELTKTK